jgi:hypothetical protein
LVWFSEMKAFTIASVSELTLLCFTKTCK